VNDIVLRSQRGLPIQQVMGQWADGGEVRKLTYADQITVIPRPR
jgi:hypothetical protein